MIRSNRGWLARKRRYGSSESRSVREQMVFAQGDMAQLRAGVECDIGNVSLAEREVFCLRAECSSLYKEGRLAYERIARSYGRRVGSFVSSVRLA